MKHRICLFSCKRTVEAELCTLKIEIVGFRRNAFLRSGCGRLSPGKVDVLGSFRTAG